MRDFIDVRMRTKLVRGRDWESWRDSDTAQPKLEPSAKCTRVIWREAEAVAPFPQA